MVSDPTKQLGVVITNVRVPQLTFWVKWLVFCSNFGGMETSLNVKLRSSQSQKSVFANSVQSCYTFNLTLGTFVVQRYSLV